MLDETNNAMPASVEMAPVNDSAAPQPSAVEVVATVINDAQKAIQTVDALIAEVQRGIDALEGLHARARGDLYFVRNFLHNAKISY